MPYKRILTIQDVSCVGQCSALVALPVLSVCGHEACLLPTAVLSTHTGGFGRPAVTHLDGALPDIWKHWKAQGIAFDAILVGYLGSVPAVHAALEVMENLLCPGGAVVVDPVMGDHGKLYSGFDDAYVREMRALCRRADWLLPNLTEAALLAGMPAHEVMHDNYVNELLSEFPHSGILLTGWPDTPEETGFLLREAGESRTYTRPRLPGSYSGTGDMFAAAFTGALMQGRNAFDAGRIAADFTALAIENTLKAPAHWYGVQFEPVLPELARMLSETGR